MKDQLFIIAQAAASTAACIYLYSCTSAEPSHDILSYAHKIEHSTSQPTRTYTTQAVPLSSTNIPFAPMAQQSPNQDGQPSIDNSLRNIYKVLSEANSALPRQVKENATKDGFAVHNMQKFFDLARLAQAGAPQRVKAVIDKIQTQANDQAVFSNICGLENAVVAYSLDHGNHYPAIIDSSMDNYLSKELNRNPVLPQRYVPSRGIINPFTGHPESPILCSVSDASIARSGQPPMIPPGSIEYCLTTSNAYVIMGGGHDGKALSDSAFSGRTLVRSSQP